MESWLRDIFAWLPGGWPYGLLLGLIAFGESLPAIGLAVPGSTLILFAGFLALHGKGDIGTIMAVSMVGAILGDLASYLIGARAGAPVIHSRALRRRFDLIRKSGLFFAAHGGKSVLFARFVGPVRGLVPFIAGCSRMRPLPFAGYTLVSGILWGIAYPGLGYLAGASWQRVEVWSGRFSLLVAALLVVTVGIIWGRRRLRRRALAKARRELREQKNSSKMANPDNLPEEPTDEP